VGKGKYRLPGLAGYRFAAVGVCDTGQEVPEVVEVGVAPIDDGEVGQTRSWLVRPSGPVAPWATRAHGLGTLDVQGAPEIAAVAPEIRTAVGDRIVVAHRGLHCHDLLARAVPGFAPDRVLDLRRLVQRVWPRTVSYALGALAHDAGVRPPGTPGRAGYEAAATALVFLAAARRVNQPAAELFACCTVLEGQLR
jgi:exodeoxyribonuclease X